LRAGGHAPVGVERFRPNIVLSGIEAHDEDRLGLMRIATGEGEVQLRNVKPCARCPIPNVDPATGEVDAVVTDTLQGYRSGERGVSFAINAIVVAGDGQTLRVGQSVAGDWQFDR